MLGKVISMFKNAEVQCVGAMLSVGWLTVSSLSHKFRSVKDVHTCTYLRIYICIVSTLHSYIPSKVINM